MKKYIIDTNALISFVTDRNPIQQKRIVEIFEDAASLKAEVICPQNVLAEFIYVMDKIYSIEKKEIRNILAAFISTPGMMVLHEMNLQTLMTVWPKQIADYCDSVLMTLGLTEKNAVVATFDRSLRTALKKAGIAVFPG